MPLLPDVLEALTNALHRESRPRNGRIYVSDSSVTTAGGSCKLAYWREHKGERKKKPTPGESLMFKAGHIMHDWIAEALRRELPWQQWRVIGVEQYVDLGPEVSGRYDLMLRSAKTGHRVIVDIKTKRGNAFSFIDKEGAKEADVLQVQMYLLGAPEADAGMVVYVDREGQNFGRPFAVQRDDDAARNAIAILRQLRDQDEPPDIVELDFWVKTNKGDDSIYLKAPWQTRWCNMEVCACASALRNRDPAVAKFFDASEKAKSGNVLVGHIQKRGIKMKPEWEGLREIVEGLING